VIKRQSVNATGEAGMDFMINGLFIGIRCYDYRSDFKFYDTNEMRGN
jgi:hypothetical protein